MKIRTVEQLLEKISTDRVWRIKEISSLRSNCYDRSIHEYAACALRRSFVPIAYAHWEGFVKKVSHYYLEFVAMQQLTLSELSPPFSSMYLTRENAKSLARGNSASLIDVCAMLRDRANVQIQIHYKDVISTNSNLDSKTLNDICSALGLSYQSFEIKKKFIDKQLVGKRNHIAHGEKQEIDKTEVELVKDEVVALIDQFRTLIENQAVMGLYKI